MRSPSRGSSRLTILMGRVRGARGLGTRSTSIWTSSFRTRSKTLAEGAIEPWTKPKYRPLFTDLKRFAKAAGIPLDVPWIDLEEEHRNLVLNGEGKFPGVRGFFAHLERKKYKLHVRVFLSRYRGYSLCPDCNGSRLRLEARQVKIRGQEYLRGVSLTVEDALRSSLNRSS